MRTPTATTRFKNDTRSSSPAKSSKSIERDIMSGRSGSFTQSIQDNIQEPSLLQCLTPFMAFLAWICSLVANFTCDYITIDIVVNNLQYYLGFGFWSYQGWSYLIQEGVIYYARTCYTYPDEVNPDPKWKAAMAFSIISVVIGGLAMCFNCCVICTRNPSKGYQCFALLYLFTCLSQGLTFLFLSSDACKNNPINKLELPVQILSLEVTCNLSWGANTGIAATVFWFVCACLMCCIGFKESKGEVDEVVEDEVVAEKGVPVDEPEETAEE